MEARAEMIRSVLKTNEDYFGKTRYFICTARKKPTLSPFL